MFIPRISALFPYTGRFISEDSKWGEDTNPLSLNLYTYCSNDPINFIDPSGYGQVWNNYGEVIGTCDGPDYTDKSQKATDTHGGGAQANIPWPDNDSGSSSSSSGGSSGGGSSPDDSDWGYSSGESSSSSTPQEVKDLLADKLAEASRTGNYDGFVWNNFGEIIGYNADGPGYTDTSKEAYDTHGGGDMALRIYTPTSMEGLMDEYVTEEYGFHGDDRELAKDIIINDFNITSIDQSSKDRIKN